MGVSNQLSITSYPYAHIYLHIWYMSHMEVFFMANQNVEVIDAMKAIIADGAIIGPNKLGIVEIDGDFPIIPKNVMAEFTTEDECQNHKQCENCHSGGYCNSVDYEDFTLSKVGGRSTITFVRWCGYQPGSVWSRWQRSYSE